MSVACCTVTCLFQQQMSLCAFKEFFAAIGPSMAYPCTYIHMHKDINYS